MSDDGGQERLHAAEERLAPAASAARTEVAQEGQASPARVEVAQESRIEDKPRIEESREDSTEVEWRTVARQEEDHWYRPRTRCWSAQTGRKCASARGQ